MATSEPQSLKRSEAPPSPPRDADSRVQRLRRRFGGSLVTIAILLLGAVVVVLFATRWDVWVGASVRQTTDDAYVRSDITPLSAKIEGYIWRVPVNDFQQVKAGDLLVAIEDDDYRARVRQAEAELAGAEAAIDNLKSRKALQHTQSATC
jgi:membrane fusion protein, multidrug efflux system